MRRLPPALLALLAFGAVTALTSIAPAQDRSGRAGPDTGLYTNGRKLDPVGRQTAVGNFPTGGAVSPDGRFYWSVSAGHGQNDVRVVEIATGRVVQTLPLPGAYVGVAFAPDGRRAYVSGERKGDYDLPPGAKGEDGDVIHVYDVDVAGGRARELDPIVIPRTSGGTYRSEGPVGGGPDDPAFPADLAVSPDGRWLVAALRNADRAAIVDLDGRRVVAQPETGAFPYGVAFDPVRPRAYVSNAYAGTVSVLEIPSGERIAQIPVGGAGGDRGAHPEGLLADPQRPRLYVAVANRDRVAVVDTERLRLARTVDLGRKEGVGLAPNALSISADRATLYVANAGEDAVAGIALADRPAAGTVGAPRYVKAVRSPASVERYDRGYRRAERARRAALRRARTPRARRAARRAFTRRVRSLRRAYLYGRGQQACAGPSAARERRYIRSVRRLQRSRRRALARATTRRARTRVRRTYERRLARAYRRVPGITSCPRAGTIAGLKAFEVIGRMPTAAYTTDVEATPDGRRLVWLAAKGLGAGPNPDYKDTGKDPYPSYVPDKLTGRVGVLSLPTDRELRGYTARTDKAIVPSNFTTPPPGTPVVGPNGGPSEKIKYVFYVVRENRTYDQILGNDPRGDGDPSLTLFADNGVPGPTGGVTPNAHALARRFPLLDHVYANSEVSIDGHIITAGGYATDYAQKGLHSSYSGRGHGADVAIFPVSFPPNGFVLDQLVRQQVSFRVYGEVGAGNQPFGNDGRDTYPEVQANTEAQAYPSQIEGGCDVGGGPPITACTRDAGHVGATSTGLGRRYRMDAFQAQFQQQLATGTVPRFNYMLLYNDHTNGTDPGKLSPKAQIADNDLALGQLVELVSNSPIWKESAIFVVEDDSQAGSDHVDAHRMPAFVISPWAKSGAVVSNRYDQYSFLRTTMLITGLQPLSLNDGLATPLYDAFVSGNEPPDLRPYRAIQPEQNLDEVNAPNAAMARVSAAMPWDLTDHVPQPIVDRILRASVYGREAPVRPGPNASRAELDRARRALRAYRRGGRPAVRTFLAAHGESEPEEAEEAEEWLKARALARTTGLTVEEAEEKIEAAEEGG